MTEVFIIKYIKALGLKVDYGAFGKHSWYFRNALVRANYNDLKNGIHATTTYLELFLVICLRECTLEERAVIELISENSVITQKELVAAIGKSISTVKRVMNSLQEKGYIRRVNGKRYGKWKC